LGEPFLHLYVGRQIGIGVAIVTDVHQNTIGKFPQLCDDSIQQIGVAASKAAKAEVNQCPVVIPIECRDIVVSLLTHAAFKKLKTLRIQWIAPFEFYGFRIEQQIQIGRGFKEFTNGIWVFAALLQKFITWFSIARRIRSW